VGKTFALEGEENGRAHELPSISLCGRIRPPIRKDWPIAGQKEIAAEEKFGKLGEKKSFGGHTGDSVKQRYGCFSKKPHSGRARGVLTEQVRELSKKKRLRKKNGSAVREPA